jgi:hypothetical protein
MLTLKTLSLRIELGFWHLAITLLSDSRPIRTLVRWTYPRLSPHWTQARRVLSHPNAVPVVAAGLALMALTWTAGLILALDPFQSLRAAEQQVASTASLANGQRGLLVLGVDRLASPGPRLQSAWLVAYFPGKSLVTLVPLYPQAAVLPSPSGHSLERAFQLDAAGAPSPEFLERLQEMRLAWSGYLVIDEIGMIALLDFVGGVTLEGRELDGAIAVGAVPLPWLDPAAALHGQSELLAAACRKVSQAAPPGDVQQFLAEIQPYIRTDLNLSQVTKDWFDLVGNQNVLACEFPLASASIP